MAIRDIDTLFVGLLVLFHTWGAWAVVEVNMEDRVEVFKGETAQINCMYTSDDGFGGVTIEWSYVTQAGKPQRIAYQDTTVNQVDRNTQFTDRVNVNRTFNAVVLTISNVQVEDQLEYVCHIKSLTDGEAEGRTMLKVFVTPEAPTIEVLERGISVNEYMPSKIGTCEVKNGFPKPNITWHKNGIPLYNNDNDILVKPSSILGSSKLYSVRSELSILVTKEDKDATFYCESSYLVPGSTMMTETKRMNITVYYPSTAVSVWVESPKGKIKEGDSVELHCHGDGNTASDFRISHKEEEIPMESNMLVLQNVTRLNSGDYVCVSMDLDSFVEINNTITLTVNYLDPAVVRPEGPVELPKGAELKATCNALSSLQTQTTWFKDGKEVFGGHVLMLKDATVDTAGMYTCVVTAPEIEGMKTNGSLQVYVQSSPKIMKSDNTEIETGFDSTVDLKCEVKGFPVPTVMWTTSDGKVLKMTSQEETKDGIRSTTSLKVTSDTKVTCKAVNVHGDDMLTFNIKAIKAETAIPSERVKKEGNGVIIAVIIICILLLAVLGSVLYYLYKKGKICGRAGKQDFTKGKSNKDNIVVEMKSDNTEEAVLLGVNGEKQPPSDQ